MKKIFLILIPLIVSVQLSTAQEKLNENKKLASTAKIWGFLKYYHPHVGSGKFNWDDELIQVIPKVEQATTKEELSLVYIEWLNHLGKVKTIKNKKQEDTSKLFTKNFDLSWLENKQLFTPELSDKLKFIENNRLKKNNHYAGKNMLGTLKIKNEPEYINFDYPNENYRLLSLFKYWNIIEYFFPYKYQTDQKWDDVLVEMIPKFKYAKDTIDYHLAMLEVVTKIDDSHGYFVSKHLSQ
ncbi:MAG TPA: peptidase S41, partial [Vicingus sp.]|nr:peptidase S41 [Vicingus sp.]